MSTKLVLLALVLTGARTRLPAQQDPCRTRTVAVSVTTEDGRLVKGLTAANFRAWFRGKFAQVVSATYDTSSRRVAIVLDASGSMADNWKVEVTVAESLVSLARAQNSYALLTFASQLDDRVDFGKGREAVMSKLQELKAKDWHHYKGPLRTTALWDTLAAALDLLRPARVGDVIYLISDGGDNSSRVKPSEVKARLLASGVRLFALITIGSLGSRGRPPEEEVGPGVLGQLVEATGGDSLAFAPGQNPLLPDSLFHSPLTETDRQIISFATVGFAREISEFYALELKLPQAVDKVRGWKLEVVELASTIKARLRVIYPRQLGLCQ